MKVSLKSWTPIVEGMIWTTRSQASTLPSTGGSSGCLSPDLRSDFFLDPFFASAMRGSVATWADGPCLLDPMARSDDDRAGGARCSRELVRLALRLGDRAGLDAGVLDRGDDAGH